jgi:Asp-tRNA(Asn)/Glu-tRNA(Gln) amidotransferase A subunit family amidase
MSQVFGKEVQRRLLVGTYALSNEMVAAFFQQARMFPECSLNVP